MRDAMEPAFEQPWLPGTDLTGNDSHRLYRQSEANRKGTGVFYPTIKIVLFRLDVGPDGKHSATGYIIAAAAQTSFCPVKLGGRLHQCCLTVA